MSNKSTVILALRPISLQCVDSRKTTKVDGEEILELTTQIFDPKKTVNYDPNLHYITKDLEGKPHLLSRALTGSEDNLDIILHYNYISNPFTIDSSMVFILPNLEDVKQAIASGLNNNNRNSTAKKENKSKTELNKTINVRDKKRIMELMKQSNPNLVTELKNQANQIANNGQNSTFLDQNNRYPNDGTPVTINNAGINEKTGNPATFDDILASLDFVRTPNMAEDDQWKAIDGKIVFGTNVSSKRCSGDISPTQGKTELIRTAVRDMIKKGEI